MKVVKKIWQLWDTTSGRVLAIIGGLSLIIGGLAIIMSFISGLLGYDKPDCLNENLNKKEFEACVFDKRDIYKKIFFIDEWKNKRVTWVSDYRSSYFWIDKTNKKSTKKNTVKVFLGPWGVSKSYGGNLIDCLCVFETSNEALKYKKQLDNLKKYDTIRFSGKIKDVKQENLKLYDCIVLEEVD